MKRLIPLFLPAVLLGCGTDVSGPSAALLSCAYGEPIALDVGDVVQLEGEDHRAVCLGSGTNGEAAFVSIPFHATAPPANDAEPNRLAVELSGAGIAPVEPGGAFAAGPAGGMAPVWLGAAPLGAPPVRDPAFHDALRRREIRELEPRIRPGRGTGAVAPAALAEPPAVGDLLAFNVTVSCGETDLRTGRVMAVTERAVVVADTANPADFTPDDYDDFGLTFDTLVYPVETAHFGEPADVDGNGRSILFFTRAVNERTPRNAATAIIGFFWGGDLFPREGSDRLEPCAASNEAEMFYLIAPDPLGVVGPAFTLEDVRALSIPLIGHEYQHLINASRRLFVNGASVFEETWLNEGLSHAAEELLFLEAAGLEPGQNLSAEDLRDREGAVDAFNEFMAPNFSNLARYLSRPDTASLMGPDLLATRGAIWAFLRYAADRSGRGDEAFFRDAVNSRDAGLDNLRGLPGLDQPLEWMRDWTVSVYADDHVPGLAARYQQQSWDMRALYEGTTIGTYPLELRALEEKPLRLDLIPGATAFLQFGMGSADRGVVRAETDGKAPPASFRGSFVRVR